MFQRIRSFWKGLRKNRAIITNIVVSPRIVVRAQLNCDYYNLYENLSKYLQYK